MAPRSAYPHRSPTAALDREALDKGAEHDALGDRGGHRPVMKGGVPAALSGRSGGGAQLKADAAENQRQQHDEDREIERRQDHRIGKREGGEERDPAEHQPGLVAVPDRRDRVHHQVARLLAWRGAEEDANAEVEPVHQHIHEDPEAEDQRPDRDEIEGFGHPGFSGGSSSSLGPARTNRPR